VCLVRQTFTNKAGVSLSNELETRDVRGVEILAPGVWNSDAYTDADLDAMCHAFTELKGRVDPPGKLGHDKAQKLAQEDGYPAIGWVTRLYRNGTKLLADFSKVPAKVAALIQAGAYNKVSSEVYFDLELDGKTYPRVLRAVSFLGADIPAVKDIRSISDVSALYADVFAASTAHYADVERPDPKQAPDDTEDGDGGDADAADMDELASLDKYCAQLEASIAGKPGAKRVRTFLSATRKELAQMRKPPFAQHSEADMDLKTLTEALGLPEDADESAVTAAIAALKAPKTADLSEVRVLQDRIGGLERDLAERNAATAVSDAIRAGKLAPAQKEWANAYALKDPDGFKSYTEKAPKLAILADPTGSEGDGGDDKPDDMALSIAKQIGVSPESLARAATRRPTAELVQAQRSKVGVA